MPNYSWCTRKNLIKITIKANNAFNQRSSSRIEWKHKDQFLFSPKWSWKFKITVVVFVAVEAGGLNKMKTSYACQGDTLDLTCPSGTVIKIMRANYGRFSVGICNEHGITDWSVNCMAPRSLRILQDRFVPKIENISKPTETWWKYEGNLFVVDYHIIANCCYEGLVWSLARSRNIPNVWKPRILFKLAESQSDRPSIYLKVKFSQQQSAYLFSFCGVCCI